MLDCGAGEAQLTQKPMATTRSTKYLDLSSVAIVT